MVCLTFEALSCALQWICINTFLVTNMSHILDLTFSAQRILHNATHVCNQFQTLLLSTCRLSRQLSPPHNYGHSSWR